MSIVLCALSLCGTAFAEQQAPTSSGDAETAMFSISGFGTAGLVHSSEHRADYTANDLQQHGAGRTRNWSADVDSRAGVQLTGRFTPQLSGVLQVTSEQRYDGTYRPQIEWANVKYDVTPDFSVRAGRIVLPSFMLSDSGKVGYASPWVRPPVEVYSLIPLTRSDGMDVTFRQRFGEVRNNVQMIFGESSYRIPGGGKVEGKRAWGIFDTLEYGPAMLRLSYARGDLTIDTSNQLANAFRQFGAQGQALADKYTANDKPFHFLGIGGSYDPGKWFVMGEWGVIETHSAYGKRTGWYVSSGYRLGKITPYVSYAQADVKSATYEPGLVVPSWHPAYATATALNAGLNQILKNAPIQHTVSVGVRWDLAKNTALKLQYDLSNIEGDSCGTLKSLQPGFVRGGKFNVFSMTLDFVF